LGIEPFLKGLELSAINQDADESERIPWMKPVQQESRVNGYFDSLGQLLQFFSPGFPV
jgi:hypothetical protein